MEDSEKTHQEIKLESEIEKLALEKEKLAQEIRHLKRPLYLNPQFLAPISAITVGIMAFIYASITGFWDTKRSILDNQKLVLQLDIAKFTKQKDSIKVLVAQSRQNLSTLQKANSTLKSEINNVRKQLSTLSGSYQSERSGIKKDIAEIDKLIQEGKNPEANLKLKALVNKLGIITKNRKFFSDEFDPAFFN